MSKLRGLPNKMRMRHDFHFVEELADPRTPESVGRMIDLDLLDPNPHQPRRTLGDISDLVSSIKEKGLLLPVLVREVDGRFQIIAGERRYHASRQAELRQIPCIEMEVDERGVLEISLIENLQRRDLTPFEEAEAILYLCERFDYTHERVAKKLGKSRTSITELLGIASIPHEIRELCRQADISTKSLLVELSRQHTIEAMRGFIEKVSTRKLSRDEARRLKHEPMAPSQAATPPVAQGGEAPVRPFTFRFNSRERQFSVRLKFDRSEVKKHEVISALQDLIRQIETSESLLS